MNKTLQSLKEKAIHLIHLIQYSKSNTEPKTIPTLKDLFNLEDWVLINNLFVHPAYLKAVERKEKILIWASLIAGVFLTLFIIKLLQYLR